MNQILQYGTEKNGKSPRGGGSASDKIVRFFAIFLMILAICLIGSGVYSLTKNKKDSEAQSAKVQEQVTATIDANIDEESGQVIISVSSDIEINKLIYNWNQKTEKEIAGESSKIMEETIDLPSGTNTLNVKVIDRESNETVKSFTFESSTGTDLIKPNITLEVTEDKNLLITATDETEIAFITYMWNEGEQITIEADEENPKEIQVELEIPKGENTINVIAVDASEKSNTNSATKLLKGVVKPEISYGLTQDGSALEFICTHENGIKSIEYTLNDRPYEAIFEDDNIPTEVSFTQVLDEGYNRIILTVTSVDGIKEKFDGQCDYYPNGNPEEETTGDDMAEETTEESSQADSEDTEESTNETNTTQEN